MKVNLYNIYKKLYDGFGSQGWWPTTKPGETRPIHRGKRPDTERERLEIVIGAILTQNTNWKNVERALENLNRKNMVDVGRLAESNQSYIASLIKSAGYYNQKAKRIKDFSRFLIKKYEGKTSKLFNQNIKDLRRTLLSISGIGPETADSIILYAALKPIFVIDAYTRRIMSRLGLIESKGDYENLQRTFMENLPKNQRLFNEYHALLVNLGKNYCIKSNPKCDKCPLKDICKFYKNNRIR